MANNYSRQDRVIPKEKTEIFLKEATRLKVQVKLLYDTNKPPLYGNFYKIDDYNIHFCKIEENTISDDILFPLKVEISFTLPNRGFFQLEAELLQDQMGLAERFYIQRPKTMLHIQRRRFFRVSPTPLSPAECSSIHGRPTANKVKIINVSQDGALLSFPSKAKIPVGSKLIDIEINFTGIDTVKLNGTVKSIFPDKNGLSSIGLQWDTLSIEELYILKTYILHVQRTKAKDKRH